MGGVAAQCACSSCASTGTEQHTHERQSRSGRRGRVLAPIRLALDAAVVVPLGVAAARVFGPVRKVAVVPVVRAGARARHHLERKHHKIVGPNGFVAAVRAVAVDRRAAAGLRSCRIPQVGGWLDERDLKRRRIGVHVPRRLPALAPRAVQQVRQHDLRTGGCPHTQLPLLPRSSARDDAEHRGLPKPAQHARLARPRAIHCCRARAWDHAGLRSCAQTGPAHVRSTDAS